MSDVYQIIKKRKQKRFNSCYNAAFNVSEILQGKYQNFDWYVDSYVDKNQKDGFIVVLMISHGKTGYLPSMIGSVSIYIEEIKWENLFDADICLDEYEEE